MKSPTTHARLLVAINAGSSSLRFAVFTDTQLPETVARGHFELTGSSDILLTHTDAAGHVQHDLLGTEGCADAAGLLLEWMRAQSWLSRVVGVGHRVVHGREYATPVELTGRVLSELEQLVPFDPQHMPAQLALIRAFAQKLPTVPQLACFDTAFHQGMPQIAKRFAIPRRYLSQGLRRYGFHGLSYEYCLTQLRELGDVAATQGRVILAHLGSGASLTAVFEGRSIDTSMGFTTAAGIPMSSRSGDLDPGVAHYLAQTERMTPDQFHHMVNYESGLLGISETSSDMRELLKLEASDIRAAEAIALFCYQVVKWIGSFAAALGGVDTLVFTGGIGENAATIRMRICERLGFLGVGLDAERNTAGAAVISKDGARVTVRVICTNEELVIAQALQRHLGTP